MTLRSEFVFKNEVNWNFGIVQKPEVVINWTINCDQRKLKRLNQSEDQSFHRKVKKSTGVASNLRKEKTKKDCQDYEKGMPNFLLCIKSCNSTKGHEVVRPTPKYIFALCMFESKLQSDGVNTTFLTSNLGFLSSPFPLSELW